MSVSRRGRWLGIVHTISKHIMLRLVVIDMTKTDLLHDWLTLVFLHSLLPMFTRMIMNSVGTFRRKVVKSLVMYLDLNSWQLPKLASGNFESVHVHVLEGPFSLVVWC